MRPFLIDNFKSTYQPRTRVVALAPLANVTMEPHAPTLLWAAIFGALTDHQHEYTVDFQREQETQRRIANAFVSAERAARLPPDQLCAILGSDAVMVGTVTGFIRYGVEHEAPRPEAFGESEILVDLQIYDCTDAELLWGYKVKRSGASLGTLAGLRARVGGDVAKRFPYRRD